MTNILDGLPTNAARYWGEYKARVETALGRFRALGLSRYTDGRGEWAQYAAIRPRSAGSGRGTSIGTTRR